MYNDVLQGKARHIGFLLGGTPQCIEDKYRGVFSYEALRSRLAEGRFASEDTQDLLSPIIRLSMLTSEEMYVLIEKLMHMHGQLFGYEPRLTQEELIRFLTIEYNRVGADTHITPREIIRDFIELLNILLQNPGRRVEEILGGEEFLARRRRTAGTTAPLRSLACERGFRAPGPIYPGLYLCQSLGGLPGKFKRRPARSSGTRTTTCCSPPAPPRERRRRRFSRC